MPGVEVSVEMKDGNGLSVDLVEASKGGEGNGVVAPEGDDLGAGSGGRERGAVADFQVSGCHLREGHGIVERRHRHVAAVEDLGPGEVRVYSRAGVEASEGVLTS